MEGLKLKEYRQKLNMTQRDVASAMLMPQAQYCRWEKGVYFPNSQQILKLCAVFNCTPNDLFGIKGVVATTLID